MVKSKVRFDGLDCAALVAYWNRNVLGRRVINIYNGPNGDTYLFKLDKLSKDESSNLMIIIESGIRFHTTRQPYENPGAPTPFCSKLRKHLRGLRLEQVQQLGVKDRVVNLVFGSGETQRHSLILELYARGNIILANSKYEIQCLLRSHEYEGVKVQVGHVYPITYATTTAVHDTNNDNDNPNSTLLTAADPMEWYQPFQPKEGDAEKTTAKSKKGGGSGSSPWKGLLSKPESGVSHYGPSLLDHCILCAGVESQKPQDLDETAWKHLQSILKEEGDRIMTALELADSKGYILYQPKETILDESSKQQDDKNDEQTKVKQLPPSPFADKFLLEFQPHLLKQHEGLASLEYDSFDRATDDFFSHIEGQKRFQRVETQQLQAQQRLEKIRKDQEQRVESLVEQQESMKRQARLVELHADMVEKAIQVVNSALDSGMDWEQLEDLVHVEQTQNQNPVALLIHKLELENDNMVLRLPKEDYIDSDDDDDDEEEEEDQKEDTMDITISLKDTAHGNASALFARYRASKEKGQKTIEASVKALEAAEETAQRQLQDARKKKGHLSQALHTKRKPLWFEKFHWFITTDNYLVIAGRDAQQNEQVVKRYLRPGDAYLHADVHGAASCVLRAKRSRQGEGGKTIPLALSDQALREAGNFTICKSSAWNSRMVTSAWWVESHQVSKTAPTGEYLTVGSFMIRGKKNFLPPTQLEMGLGVLFRLGDDESIARHKNDRRDFALMEMEQDDIPLDDDMPPLQPEKPVSKPKAPVAVTVESSKVEEEENPVPDTEDIQEEEDVEQDKSPDDSEDDDDNGNQDDENEIEGQNGENEDDQSQQTESNQPKKKKGLSVRDRKLIRKYGSLEAGMAAEAERLKNEVKPDASVTSSPTTGATEQSTNEAPKRGRKARQKKIAKKYADQDEEDRELALLALHAGEKSKKKDKGKKAPTTNETEKEAAAETLAILKKDASIVAAELDEEVRKILAECITVKPGDPESPEEADVRWDKFDADVIEQLLSLDKEQKIAAAKRLLNLKQGTRIDNFSASLAGIIRTIRKYGHKNLDTDTTGADDTKRKTKADKEAESTAWKQTLAEEGVVDGDIEEDTIDDTIELMKLTGKPHPEDLILFAVPVCAPYMSLSKYNHRVKLTPGNLKRGKASKQCVAMFLKDGPKTPANERNRELVKKVADNEWVQAICGDVKISAAGASKLVKKQKTNKKSKQKK